MALKEEEAAVYDRQLRVWGVETQRKLTAARVLLVGFGKLAAEISKNITLAGVGHVTLLDDSPAADLVGSNFLITTAGAADGQTAAQAAAKSLQAMNPLVKVTAADGSTAAAADGSSSSELLAGQDLVIATGLPLQQVVQLDGACRAAGVKFMAAAAAGPAGWFFADLQQHTYTPKESKSGPVSLHYSSAAEALAVRPEQLSINTHPMHHVLQACLQTEQQLKRPLTAADLPAAQQQLRTSCSNNSAAHQTAAEALLAAWLQNPEEFAPVCAVLGGVIANNVVAAVSAASEPLNNLLYYSLVDSRAIVEQQPPATVAAAATGKAAGKEVAAQQEEDALLID